MKSKIIGITLIFISAILFIYAGSDKVAITSSSNLSNIYMEDDGATETECETGTYSVIYDFAGHGGTRVTDCIPEGTVIETAPEVPTASGYRFDGWFKEESYTNLWNFETDKVTSNITLYAKWTEEPGGSSEEVSSSNTEQEQQETHTGELNKTLFDYIVANQENDNAIVKFERASTGQTGTLTEYRYVGADAQNYVDYNDELWRIVGAFQVDNGAGKIENRVKLVRNSVIGELSLSWDSSASTINEGLGINQWGETVKSDDSIYSGADIMKTLNTNYLNRTKGKCSTGNAEENQDCTFEENGLNDDAKKMIAEAKWYTGEVDGEKLSTLTNTYFAERGTELVKMEGIEKTNNWNGLVGLLYPSDYTLASSECGTNEEKVISLYNASECKDSNWLYENSDIWTITPSSVNTHQAFYLDKSGSVNVANTSVAYSLKPTVYLKTSVKVIDGAGTKDIPYQLSVPTTSDDSLSGDVTDVPITDSTKSLILYLISLILVLIGAGVMWYSQNKDKVKNFISKLQK